MLDSEDYLIGWIVYLSGAVGLMVCWWWITRNIALQEVRNLLRLTIAVVLLMPYPVDYGSSFWAPAVIISLIEGVTQGADMVARTAIPILIALFCSILLALVLEWLHKRYLDWYRRRFLDGRTNQVLEKERSALLSASLAANATRTTNR